MQSGYGVSEIQQFMVDGSVHSTLFSISSTTPTNGSAAIAGGGGGQDVHHSSISGNNSHKMINPFHHHQHHAHKPQQQAAAMEFPQFHPVPITQQLFTRLPHPQHHQQQFQFFNNNPSHYDHRRRIQPAPTLLDHEPDPENHSATGGTMPSFLAASMNFKLAIDDSSGSGSKDGLNNDNSIGGGILHGDDVSESRLRPWQREEECSIKEPFWRPLDLDCINRNNKRCKEKEVEERHFARRCREVAGGLENSQPPGSDSNYKLFSELEAIYRPGSSTSIAAGGCYKSTIPTNQTTGSGSVLTGDDHPVMPTTTAAAPESRVDVDDNNSTGDEPNQIIKKLHQHTRRRQRRRKLQHESIAAFFEDLVKQLMDHQELLHQKFIDTMEQCDGERAGREEARREQEAARARREAAARAQDRALAAAREAALVSFLEKITGETLNLPVHPQQINPSSAAISIDGTIAPTTMKTCRWPKAEVQALIALRSGLEARFQEPGLKGPLWEEVSAAMGAIGFERSAKRCKEKWENINKYFRKAKCSGRKRSQHSKTCPYFHQLDQLYSKSIPDKNSELLDAVVDAGGDRHGFSDGEEVADSEGRGQAEEEEFIQ